MMKKIGLFYSFASKKTSKIAGIIHNSLLGEDVQLVNVDEFNKEKFSEFDNLIIGVPTWFDGELPNYWDELLPALEDIDFSSKRIAIFGLGDQKGYPENFCDAIGIMAAFFEEKGALIVGKTSLDGYAFEGSKGVRDGQFVGLPLDQENQARLTNGRIEQWVENLKKEFI
ncbi:MAG TPA: flavodoxin [Prolixibacteraceae bacterium]|jgi:flavodoxin I